MDVNVKTGRWSWYHPLRLKKKKNNKQGTRPQFMLPMKWWYMEWWINKQLLWERTDNPIWTKFLNHTCDLYLYIPFPAQLFFLGFSPVIFPGSSATSQLKGEADYWVTCFVLHCGGSDCLCINACMITCILPLPIPSPGGRFPHCCAMWCRRALREEEIVFFPSKHGRDSAIPAFAHHPTCP